MISASGFVNMVRMNAPSLRFATAIALFVAAGTSPAAPYASGVRVEAGNVTFLLNEPAGNVTVEFTGPDESVPLGALPAGAHSFALGAHTAFRIVVENESPPGWRDGALLQTSDSASPLVQFANPRGVAVNTNPGSPYFGRVYVSVGAEGTTAQGRSVSDGIYLLNPDLTATAAGDGPHTGGIDFTGSTESPFRLTVAPDDTLFITDWSDTTGSLYVADPDAGTVVNALPGPAGGPFPLVPETDPPSPMRYHGSISAVVVEGKLSEGNQIVYVIDEDLQPDPATDAMNQRNSIWTWYAGAGPYPLSDSVIPEQLNNSGITYASQRADLVQDPQGFLYKVQRRADNQPQAGIFIIDPTGSAIADSKTAWLDFNIDADPPVEFDIFLEAGAVDISHDRWLAVYHYLHDDIRLVPIVELEGSPAFDFSRLITLQTREPAEAPAASGRDIAFDAAGNLYAVSSHDELLRVFSPGGTTRAVTGSDGTFQIEYGAAPAPAEPPVITGVSLTTGTLTVNVTAAGAESASLQLEQAGDPAAGPWTPEAAAVVSGTAPEFTITTTVSGSGRRFFRVRRL